MDYSKLFIIAGVVFIAIGVVWFFLGKYIPLGKLPGDIAIEKGNAQFYFPITTSIVLSIVLSLIWFIYTILAR